MISILPYGDSALLISFEQRIDRLIHAQVLDLRDALTGVPGIRYMIPAYCTLTVVYDSQATSLSLLQTIIYSIRNEIENRESFVDTNRNSPVLYPHPATRISQHIIPVCYEPEFSPDLKEISAQTGRSAQEIIDAHLNTEFYVYMLGFMPGFAYMGDMPKELSCSRKETPRTKVPAGSVGLALRQTAIYPFESPGGWQIIGRTPLKMFDPLREKTSLLSAGDMVRFKRISFAEYEKYQ